MKNREFKFLAWNKKTNLLIDLQKITPLALSCPQKGVFLPFDESLELMQFTGFYDRHEAEIYENFVMRTDNDELIGLAIWNKGRGFWMVRVRDAITLELVEEELLCHYVRRSVVIGSSLWEYPGLWEKENQLSKTYETAEKILSESRPSR